MTRARYTSNPGQALSADGRSGAHAARIRRSGWLLGGLAILFYVGYIAYYFVRSGG